MPTAWAIEREGRRIGVVPRDAWKGYRLALTIDGEEVAEGRSAGRRVTVGHDDVEVRVHLAWHGLAIVRAELQRQGAPPLPLEPEPGSLAARRERFAREHPALFAAQHVVVGIGKVVLPLVGIGLLVGLLAEIPWPAVDLPSIPAPSIDLPSIPLPSIDLPEIPGWIQAVVESSKYWGPIVAGVWLAIREYRRRQRERDAQSGTRDEPSP